MPENTGYFEAITAHRAMLLNDEQALEGTTTISLETQGEEFTEDDIFTYIEENFGTFVRLIRYLSKDDQEMLLSYYVLAKTQTNLALIERTTQTLCSFLLRKAVERIGSLILLGEPTEELMKEIFTQAGLEDSLRCGLSKAVAFYDKCRSYNNVANRYGLHRPDVRRAMRKAATVLEASTDHRQRSLSAVLHGLCEKASASGTGLSARQMAKQGHQFYRDPEVLGKFRISLTEPGFRYVFTSRANR